MEISRDALSRVIKAARMAHDMAETIREMTCGTCRNKADDISGILEDALFDMNGEKLGVKDDFSESKTYQWLFGCSVPEDRIAGEFIRMAEENKPKQPKPNLINRDQFNAMLKRAGGYSTPEGEWK